MSNPENLQSFIEEFDPDGDIDRDGQEVILLEECTQLQRQYSRWGATESERAALRARLALTYYCLTQIDEKRARRYTKVFDYIQSSLRHNDNPNNQ